MSSRKSTPGNSAITSDSGRDHEYLNMDQGDDSTRLPLQYSPLVVSLRHVSFHPDQIRPPYLVAAEPETLKPAHVESTSSTQVSKDVAQLSSQTDSVRVSLSREPLYFSSKNMSTYGSHLTSCDREVWQAAGRPFKSSDSVTESQIWNPRNSRPPMIFFGPLTHASNDERRPFLLSLAYVGFSPTGLTISEMALVTKL